MAQIDEDPAWLARCLLRSVRVGTLATSAKGQPFASLVTPACTPDLSVLLLLSSLSEHTRHLVADPRCSILVAGAAEDANPQTAPRLTVTGLAERVPAEQVGLPVLKARYLAVHPYATLYADFGDFAIWRVKPMAGLFVGGFARATRLAREALMPPTDAVEAIAAAEAGIIEHCNRDHPDAMAAIAGEPGDWRIVTADVDGFDLALGERVQRFAWSAPVREPGDVRRELVRLTQAAREA
jgi:putative heme iron utilization protein